jgi:hypothetical protein
MPYSRRYIFHAHATVLGGRVLRRGENPDPKKQSQQLVSGGFVDLPASALTAVGGRSTVSLRPSQLGNDVVKAFVDFRDANAQSVGEFEDLNGHYRATLEMTDAAKLRPKTTAKSDVSDLRVGLVDDVKMRVRNVTGGLVSVGSVRGGQTPVAITPETGFANNQVVFETKDGAQYTLVVAVDCRAFNDNPTMSGLQRAAKTASFLAKLGHCLHLGQGASKSSLTLTDSGNFLGTIVQPLTWLNNRAYPGASFDKRRKNMVNIPGLGRLSFGEIIIGRHARRLTMIRGELGCPIGADMAIIDNDVNGEWS